MPNVVLKKEESFLEIIGGIVIFFFIIGMVGSCLKDSKKNEPMSPAYHQTNGEYQSRQY